MIWISFLVELNRNKKSFLRKQLNIPDTSKVSIANISSSVSITPSTSITCQPVVDQVIFTLYFSNSYLEIFRNIIRMNSVLVMMDKHHLSAKQQRSWH